VEKLSDGHIMLVQKHMIERCLELVGIPVDNAVHTKVHDTPANPSEILHKDPQGSERKHSWNYRAIVGALTYLMAMARPELAYAVHQCSRFSNDPKQSHERAIKRICCYLKSTQDQGLIIDPDLSKGLECYVDADWAGNWNKNFQMFLTMSIPTLAM